MNYIIVNNSTFDDFLQKAKAFAALGHSFSICYVAHVTNPPIPGGWGALRFSGELPSQPIFIAPDVEYRYSPTADAWLANGATTQHSDWVKSFYAYFADARWSDL